MSVIVGHELRGGGLYAVIGRFVPDEIKYSRDRYTVTKHGDHKSGGFFLHKISLLI